MAPTTRSTTGTYSSLVPPNTTNNKILAVSASQAVSPFLRICMSCHKYQPSHMFGTPLCKARSFGPQVCHACASIYVPVPGTVRVDSRKRGREEEEEEDREGDRRAAKRVKRDVSDDATRYSASGVTTPRVPVHCPVSFIKLESSPEPELNRTVATYNHDAYEADDEVSSGDDVGDAMDVDSPADSPDMDPFWIALRTLTRVTEDQVSVEVCGATIEEYENEESLDFMFYNLQ